MRKLFLVFFAIGIVLLVKGAWIPFKAVVAQFLLKNAWEQTVKTGKNVKPWPWADTWPVARIIVPSQHINLIVLEGDSGQVLAFGPGRISKSAYPSSPGNTILVGHRDTSFSFLRELGADDVLILIDTLGQKHNYTVTETAVMKAEEIYLKETAERWLTLITCYPFTNIKPRTDQRYIVIARG